MSRFGRKIMAGAGVLAATVGILLVSALPAAASIPDGRGVGDGAESCKENTLCFWAGQGFQEKHDKVDADDVPGSFSVTADEQALLPDFGKLRKELVFFDAGMQDTVSSVFNNSIFLACIYADNNFQGEHIQLAPRQQIAAFPPSFENQLSSAKLGPCPK